MLAQWSVHGGEVRSINAARQTGGCEVKRSFDADMRVAIAVGKFSPTGNASADELSRSSLMIGRYGIEFRYQQLLRQGPSR
jgi:hypothetical protein